MGILKVKDREGSIHELNAEIGSTIMEIIRDAGLVIEAACGGCCACATCHIYITNDKIKNLIVEVNNIEFLVKKYPSTALNITTNFILEQAIKTNN